MFIQTKKVQDTLKTILLPKNVPNYYFHNKNKQQKQNITAHAHTHKHTPLNNNIFL